MTSILRRIVAGPRMQHQETGLDLCYVTDNIIVTSGPSSTYPSRAYRNPLDKLVSFLDSKHGQDWYIWEFRAEGTGYPDSEVYGRIHHFPWPDHQPPPFALIPAIVGNMRNWINRHDEKHEDNPNKKDQNEEQRKNRVAVVHCKAGKGRSGTIACSYLISQEGWKMEDAIREFTERRMRAGFGAGVSIPSQIRWIRYVDRWANTMGEVYVEWPVEILELHILGLRDDVKVAVEGFVDDGRKVKCFHLFRRHERIIIDDGNTTSTLTATQDDDSHSSELQSNSSSAVASSSSLASEPVNPRMPSSVRGTANVSGGHRIPAVILKPSKSVIVPTSDVNIDFERRGKAAYAGWAMVTSVAHVWFNAYFEGDHEHNSGVFEVDWGSMDGIKGSVTKGTRALDRLKVVWRYLPMPQPGVKPDAKRDLALGNIVREPEPEDPVPESHPADWRGDDPFVAEDTLRTD